MKGLGVAARAVGLATGLAALASGASAELRPVLPGTKLDWSCTGEWRSYSEAIVSADDRELVKDAWIDGKKYSTTRRPIWLRGSSLYAERAYHGGGRGPRTSDYDWNKLRGFADMTPGWSHSGAMLTRGSGGGKSWSDTVDFTVRHEGRETYKSDVYGEIEVIRTTTRQNWRSGAREECEALVFPADAVQVRFSCSLRSRRSNFDVTCDLKDRY